MIVDFPRAGAEPERFATVAIVSAALSGRSDDLTYRIPADLADQIVRGSVVWVPLRDRLTMGVVLGSSAEPPEFATRSIVGTDPSFTVSESQLTVAGWIARETATSLGLAASLFFPPGLEQRAEERLAALPETGFETLTPIQAQTLAAIRAEGTITPDDLRKRTKRALT
ncbi:hypothetical protein BH09CHL1_BH09CHL1_06170 [soil metagenome]